ncbi:glycosyltransferase family 2 protein [Rhizobium sp. B21/90]|nr:glycosyltransferase family 2 protein [Rhizobium sp. B21/90]
MSSNPIPTFSVVIPVYNRAHLIMRALNSVFDQTWRDLEIIVVDDGSTDDIEAVIDRVADERLNFIRQHNAGASVARNTGIDAARGRFVAFLDSDDAFLPRHLQLLLGLLGTRQDLAVYSPIIVDRGNGNTFVKPPRGIAAGEDMALYLICNRGFVQTSGLALPTDIARAVRYRPDARFGDDTDFAIRLQLAGCQFVMHEEPSVIWYDGWRTDRLSIGRASVGDLPWLDALRPHIAKKAYHGYRGWHFAKSIAPDRPLLALGLYLRAVVNGAFSPGLAGLVFLQIFASDRTYRWLADWRISKTKLKASR